MAKTATQPTNRLRTQQTVMVRQVISGRPDCAYCGEAAAWLYGSGAQPELQPLCSSHTSYMLRLVAETIEGVIRGTAA